MIAGAKQIDRGTFTYCKQKSRNCLRDFINFWRGLTNFGSGAG